MNNYINYFTNYVCQNYDISDKLVSLKYYHSLRVAYIMSLLASKLNMNEEDQLLAFKLGLCHDLGRFYEVLIEGKFNNLKFDHASYSNKILYNDSFVNYMDIDDHLLFRKAIYNHNKKDITNDLNEKEFIFTNLLRDADKIDILGIKGTKSMIDFDVMPSLNVVASFMTNRSIDLKDIKGTTDQTILFLSFYKDLYYRVSHDTIKDFGYLDEFLNKVRVHESKEDIYGILINKMNKERGKVYVR